MTESLLLLLLGIGTLALIPLAPALLRFRIRILRTIHLQRLARLHETGFGTLVLVIRLMLLIVAAIFFWLATQT